jgi:hypothetical protein
VPPAAGLLAAPGAVVGVLRSRVMAGLASLFDPQLAAWPAGELRDPPSYEAYREMQAGMELFHRGEFRLALPRFERAERLDPTRLTARFLRAMSHANLREPARADSLIRSADRAAARPTSLEAMALDELAAYLRGDLEAAYALSKVSAPLAPNTPPHVQFGIRALQVNRVGEAVRVFRAIDPEAPVLRGWRPYWTARAWAHHLAGEYDEALEVARRGRARVPTQLGPARSEADALAALGRTAELTALLDEQAARSAGDPAAHGALMAYQAAELRAHGHAAAGQALAERAVAWLRAETADRGTQSVRGPAAAAERGVLVSALYTAGRWREARALVEPLGPADSADVDRLAYAGLTAARLGDTLAARRYDARLAAVRTPYLSGGPTYRRARLAAVLGERDRAVALLREAFTQGTPYYRTHAERDFEGLRGYEPFDALVRPKE